MTKKIEGVKDAFKILERRCKDQKKILDKTIERKKLDIIVFLMIMDNLMSIKNRQN